MRPETSIWFTTAFAALLVALAAAGAWALSSRGALAVAYAAAFVPAHAPALWAGCRGCPKRGRRCVVIPHGGRVAARLFPPRPALSRPARAFALAWLIGWYALPTAVASREGVGPAVAVHGALLVTYALLRRAAVQVVYDGWATAAAVDPPRAPRWNML